MNTTPRADAPPTATPTTASQAPTQGLGAELRESLLLLGFALGVTVGLTTVAQAALSALA
jgi:hypothetical protein